MKKLILLTAALFPLLVFAGGAPLPRGLEALEIDVPVGLDMRGVDAAKIKGHVVKSGRFVAITSESRFQVSMDLDPKGSKVRKIVVALGKDRFDKLVKRARRLYTEGNQYEREKLPNYEANVWKDKKTRLALIRAKGAYRLELADRKE